MDATIGHRVGVKLRISSQRILMLYTSLPPHLPCHIRRDSGGFKTFDHSLVPALACSFGDPNYEHGGLYISSNCWFKRRRKGPRWKYRVSKVLVYILFLAQ
jgi:hypothetical protein